MPINNSQANFISKAGDTDYGITAPRYVPVIRQANGTGEDASVAFPMPTSDAVSGAALGTPTDTPVAFAGADEDATARTGISLLKRIANALKSCAGNLGLVYTESVAINFNTMGIQTILSSGLPTYGADATGADTYATVVTVPARVCYSVHVSVENNGAIISLNGGTTDHYAIPANTERLFTGLSITQSVAIQGKNLSAGNNYTNLRISVW